MVVTSPNDSEIIENLSKTEEDLRQLITFVQGLATKNDESSSKKVEDAKDEETPLLTADSEFWVKFSAINEKCVHECNKLGVIFSQSGEPCNSAPSLQACKLCCDQIENLLLALVQSFASDLPRLKNGLKFWANLHKALLDAVQSSADFFKCLQRVKRNYNAKFITQSVGMIWQSFDTLSKVPKNNREAVLKHLKECSCLIEDALEELTQLLDDSGDQAASNDTSACGITPENPLLVEPCLNIFKVSKGTISKINSSIESRSAVKFSVEQLDKICIEIDKLSPSVDNLASCLYLGACPLALQAQASQLCECIKMALNAFRHSEFCTTQEERHRVDFLQMAADHNFQKLLTNLKKLKKSSADVENAQH